MPQAIKEKEDSTLTDYTEIRNKYYRPGPEISGTSIKLT